MKYLSVIYYDTFARFFCAIEDAVKKIDKDFEFLHLAIFPSGYAYLKTRRRSVKLLPWEIRKPCFSGSQYDINALDKITKYHSVVGERYGPEYKYKLRSVATKYIDALDNIVKSYNPDVVLFSGDTRIACESLQFCLDRMGCTAKSYYFEQGPNGTTIFDTQGVNANCSFRKELSCLTGGGFPPVDVSKSEKFKRNPIYRGSDYLIIGALRLLGKVPPEWDSLSLRKYPKKEYMRCVEAGRNLSLNSAKEILIALQVPDDANNIHHNSLGLGDAELVKMVLAASLPSTLVRVREHPLYRRRYSNDLYKLLSSSSRGFLSDKPLEEDLSTASVVVTINSMTGLDAYVHDVPVVVLGNAFYDHLPGIERACDIASLKDSIERVSEKALSESLSGKMPAEIFSEMKSKYFIQGHYFDRKLISPKIIAKVITNSCFVE